MRSVNDAIILAGGRGTRMLPASLFTSKEMLPLVDTPIINHLIWEAARSGVKRIHLVLSEWKKGILDAFLTGEHRLPPNTREDLPEVALTLGLDKVELKTYLQKSALGVADAISCVLHEIDGPFLVLLGDNLVISDHKSPLDSGVESASNASRELVMRYLDTGLPAVGLCKVGKDELNKYGVVKFENGTIKSIVEKPKLDQAPSNYILCGRYVFPTSFNDLIEKYDVSKHGEHQSIEILNHIIKNEGLDYVKFDDYIIFDSGDPINWLKSQIIHALARNDLSPILKPWLEEILPDN